MATASTFNFSCQARYFQQGQITADTTDVWVVLHGYGQLAEYFIRPFSVLDDGKACILAPEGLSRFYLQGFSGRVGATWMTREDRLADIENYLCYLDRLYEVAIAPTIPPNARLRLLGFSQGAATVCRWAQHASFDFHSLVLWAGVFPHDLDLAQARGALKDKPVYFVYGDQDEFITGKQMQELGQVAAQLGIAPRQIVFEGRHEIKPDVLARHFGPGVS